VILSSIGDAVLAANADGRLRSSSSCGGAYWLAIRGRNRSKYRQGISHINETTGELLKSDHARDSRRRIVGLANTRSSKQRRFENSYDDSGAPVKDERGASGRRLVFETLPKSGRVERERQLALAEVVKSQQQISGIWRDQ